MRVALRYPVEADRQAFLALRRSSRREFQRWEPKPRPGFDPYGDDAFDMEMRRSRSRTARRLLICRRDDGVVVGHVGMGVIVRGDLQQCFVGYWIGTPFTGRGFMTEALRLAADFIFLRLGCTDSSATSSRRTGPHGPWPDAPACGVKGSRPGT